MAERRVSGFGGLQAAFDEVRFGDRRTLNLRASLPTAADAAARLESWLREQQVQRADELLIVTGRGNNSEDGISRVREAALRVMHELKRKGVVKEFAEHTAGSFVVTVAPMKALLEAASRRREQTPLPPPAEPPTLATLTPETRKALRGLAEYSLDALGVRERGPFVENEMLRLFGTIAATVPEGADRERRLHDAIVAALREYD